MNNTIGVIGCGWFGLPLAKQLVLNNYVVRGTTTSKEKIPLLLKENIQAFLITLSETEFNGAISNFLKELEVLIVNIPPKLRGGGTENYVKKIELLHKEITKSKVKKVIFISSTSVYGNMDGEVTEKTVPTPNTESGKQLLLAENIFKKDADIDATIVRFGGLVGSNRHPINMLSGRKNLSGANAPVNLIHLDDCIRIIEEILTNSWWNEILNGVYPNYPSKQKYYSAIAIKKGLQIPDYKIDNSKKGKLVRSNILLNVKNFKFKTTP